MNKFPIETKDLVSWLPHRPPMIWIDRVLEADEKNGIAESFLDQHPLIKALPANLRDTAAIEIMAQAYGYVRVCQSLFGFLPPRKAAQKAFLAQVRNAEIFIPLVNVNKVSTEVELVRDFGELCLVRCRIINSKSGATVASAELKIFSSEETGKV